MKVKYSREVDILTLELSRHALIDHAEQSGDIIIHVASDDTPVLLEVLNASAMIAEIVKQSILAPSQLDLQPA